jgi:hypothetical protein
LTRRIAGAAGLTDPQVPAPGSQALASLPVLPALELPELLVPLVSRPEPLALFHQ